MRKARAATPPGMIAFAMLAMLAAVQDAPRPPPERIVNAEVFGQDACPVAKADEIVVCKRLPEGDRFRLPPRFRKAEETAGNTAWATRVETMDEIGRRDGGVPNSCSVVGSAGQTGCTQEAIRRWYAERRAAQAVRAEADGDNR